LEKDAKPPFCNIYRMSPNELEEAKKQVATLMERDWIRPSTSPFGAPVLLGTKKGWLTTHGH